jgi:hypothetical protein
MEHSPQLVKKFRTRYEPRRFVTLFTKAPPLVPIMRQTNQVHINPTYLDTFL